MKKIFLERYKIINAVLFIVGVVAFAVMASNYNKWFQNADITYINEVFDSIYHPIMVSLKWLATILGTLLFFPARYFRKWLFFIAPPIIFLTYMLVQGISVNSGNLVNATRAEMAENGMFVLGVITALYVVGHLVYDFRKKNIKV